MTLVWGAPVCFQVGARVAGMEDSRVTALVLSNILLGAERCTSAEDTPVKRECGPQGLQPGSARRSASEGHSQGHRSLPKETTRREQWIGTHKIG